RNPVGSVLARACARHAQAAAGELIGAMAQEHERAAGAWHAEWDALARALGFTGGAAAAVGEALGGLEVHADRMRQAAEEHAARIGAAADPGPAGVWIDRALAAWRES
ncbi:MAG: 3-carboxy-cis,cis-muconate cycloisomerase, partial [Thermoleophilaceae bacterium]|nr:3-carboxy-cis,cis-muconate cycloisomerase [Thermoleophilaceae bacterium]